MLEVTGAAVSGVGGLGRVAGPRLGGLAKTGGPLGGLQTVTCRRNGGQVVGRRRRGERLGERGIAFKHYAKPTNTRPAPLPLRQQIATEVNLVIEGLSD